MYEQKMDSTFSEELEAMEAWRLMCPDYSFTTCMIWMCTMPQQETAIW